MSPGNPCVGLRLAHLPYALDGSYGSPIDLISSVDAGLTTVACLELTWAYCDDQVVAMPACAGDRIEFTRHCV